MKNCNDKWIPVSNEEKLIREIEEKGEEEQKKKGKKNLINHWTKEAVEQSVRKINKEIYEHDRQASIIIKLDDLAVFVNHKITRRGISRGYVNIQEDFNKNLLIIEKIIFQALDENEKYKKYNLLFEAKQRLKLYVWTDIRFLMINKAITPGEITELIRRSKEINTELDKWIISIKH